jgi:hypothetical protein
MFKKTVGWLKGFFLNYIWIGFSLILLSIITSLQYSGSNLFVLVSVELLKTIGVAIMVAAVFTFAAGTSEFIERIRKLLQEIVVTRKFLGNIAPESKKLALHALLHPSDAEANRYADIDEYYDLYVDRTLDISQRNVRGNYQINGTVFKDTTTGKVAINALYSYRLFPSSAGFGSVDLAFYKEDKLSRCEKLTIYTPEGVRKNIDKPEMKKEKYGKVILRKFSHDLSEYNDSVPHLDIELRVTEYGFDHWILHEFQALQPTDGFKYTLRCRDKLTVKKSLVFVFECNYHIEEHDHKMFSITCNQWITEGAGVAVIIGPEDDNVAITTPSSQQKNSADAKSRAAD